MEQKPQPPIPPQNVPQHDPLKPVAYDVDGNPLYAAPPQMQYQAQAGQGQPAPQVVHLSRAIDPIQQEVSPEVQRKHDQSVKEHPALNLSSHEYIINSVRRHPIGLLIPVGLTVFLVALAASIIINYEIMMEALGVFDPPAFGPVFLIGFLLILLFSLGGYIAVWVYMNNRFFLTNESVIQELQMSLFMRKEQTVSLANIEDASFDQHGILQTILNYGSIRLSTEGDETTYRFTYVSNPKKQIEILNNAVEAFKNGRPVDEG